MLKKIYAIFSICLLFGCAAMHQNFNSYGAPSYNYVSNAPTDTMSGLSQTDYSHVDLGNHESFRVAMLLPLSGKAQEAGESMKNAAMLAIGDLNNNNLVVQFYDTKSTSSGARVAVENAVSSGCDLILGPLMSEEVAAITPVAKDKDIPVISFSTSPSVLQEGIYTLGLLNEEQIDKIVKYAVQQGRKRIAVVLPDNQSGLNMLKSAMASASAEGASITKVGFYRPEEMDFSSLVTSMIGSSKVAASQSKDTEKSSSIGVGFDALLVPESGNRLKSITSMFSYYDVAAPEVLFMGTSVWANSNLSKETELYGAVYPLMSDGRMKHFAYKYNEMFSQKPNPLGIFAYDAIALSSALSQKDKSNLTEEITNIDGFFGMSGAFRIFANGKNEHGLDVVKVTMNGPMIAVSAPQRFYSVNPSYSNNRSYGGYEQQPQIYGKSSADVWNLINAPTQTDYFEPLNKFGTFF